MMKIQKQFVWFGTNKSEQGSSLKTKPVIWMLLIHNSSFVLSTQPCASSHPSLPLSHTVQPAVTELPYSKDLFTASVLNTQSQGRKSRTWGWDGDAVKLNFLSVLKVDNYKFNFTVSYEWDENCVEVRLLSSDWIIINVIASDKTLTAGWSFQYGWPWAGSSCPGRKGLTHPRKSTASQRRHGLEVGTTYWPHGCKGTSSGSWRLQKVEERLTNRKKERTWELNVTIKGSWC